METIFECKAGELLTAIQSVAGVIDPKATIAVNRNVLVEACKDGTAKLMASGPCVQLSTTVRLGAKADTSITLNPQAVVQYLKTYDAGQNVRVSVGGDKVEVRAGRNRTSQRSLPAQDFMPMKTVGELGEPVKITSGMLRKLIAQTVFCAPVNDTRVFLNGVCLEIEGDTITAIATDGHRMAVSSAVLPEMNAAKSSVIIPTGVAHAILKILSEDAKGKSAPNESSASVTLQFASTQAVISYGNFAVRTQLLEGKYPQWRNVLLKHIGTTVEMAAADLENCLDGANVLRDNVVYAVTLAANAADELRLSAKNKEQETFDSAIAASCQGPSFMVNVNPKFIKDAMVVFGKDDACVLSSAGEEADQHAVMFERKTAEGLDTFKYVVMPMRI